MTCSSVRLDELHGPYCDILRDTLLIGTDGRAYACGFRAGSPEVLIGWPGRHGGYELDRQRIAVLREAAVDIPVDCRSCLNGYHCARKCPAFCQIQGDYLRCSDDVFRCRLEYLLAAEWILSAASELGRDALPHPEEADSAVRGDNPI